MTYDELCEKYSDLEWSLILAGVLSELVSRDFGIMELGYVPKNFEIPASSELYIQK